MKSPKATGDSSDQPVAEPEGGTGTPAAGRSAFPLTQWSMVLSAGTRSDTQAHAALEALCRRYWYPLYLFVRRQGRSHHEAEDCTQEFVAHLLAAGSLEKARPERGRFRTFLLTSLRNFLTSDWRRTQATKRGGGIVPVSLNSAAHDGYRADELADKGFTPEQAFDRTWAFGMIDRAVAELRAEYRNGGRGAVFEALAPLVWGNANPDTLAREAARCELSVAAFTVALHRARRRLGDRLRALVAETVADQTEIDAELRHLVTAVSAGAGSG